jgi:hypothetical protein
LGKNEGNNDESHMIAVWQFLLAYGEAGELFFKKQNMFIIKVMNFNL